MAELLWGLDDVPIPARWALRTSVGLGVVGGLVGLAVGVSAHPPTAWFAVLELGLPSAFVGAWVGLAAGGVASAVRRVRHAPPPG